MVLSPRLAASWSGWRGGTLKAAYAEAFRAPSWDETSNATDRRIAADGLAPEKVRSIEASAQQQVGPHRLMAGVFYARWTNLVELSTLSDAEAIQAIRDGRTSVPFTPGVQLTQYRNVSSIHNYGLNAGLDGALWVDRLQYGLTLTAWACDSVLRGGAAALGGAPGVDGIPEPGVEKYLRVGAAGEDLDGLDKPLDFEAVFLPPALSQRKLGEVLLQLRFILGSWIVAEQQRQGHVQRLHGRDGLVESNRADLLFDAGNGRWIDV